jgi:hypothetical protein
MALPSLGLQKTAADHTAKAHHLPPRRRAGQALDTRACDYCTTHAASLAATHLSVPVPERFHTAVWSASTIP